MRMSAVVVILASACLSCVAQVNASPRVLAARDLEPIWTTDDMRQAAAALEAEDWDTARAALLKSATGKTADSEMPRRRFLLGYACVQAGDPLGAVAVLDGLEAEIPPATNWVRHLRGQALFELGRHEEAIAAFLAIERDSPLYRDAQSRAAEALTILGRHAEAAATWERSGRRDAEAVAKHAAAMVAAGRKGDALGLLRRAYFKTAASGRRVFRAAMEALGLSVEPRPSEVLDQAQAMLDAHMNREAEREATPLVASKDPDSRCRALMIRGLARQKLRRHPDALGDFTAAIDGCGDRIDRARALFLAIRSAFRGGDRDSGDALAQRLRTDFPNASFNDDVALTRARIAVSRGDPAAATQILEDSLVAWPDGDMADETRWLLAWASYKSRDLEDALARLREGARFATDLHDRSRFAYWEARVLQRLGRKDEARQAYEATVLDFPLKYHAWLALNRLTAMAGRKATLVGVLDALLQEKSRGRPFLAIEDPGQLDSGAIGRAVWLSRTGLPSLAARELARGDRDAGLEARWLGAWLLDLGNRHTRSHRLAASLLAESDPFWPDAASKGYFQLAYPRPHAPLVEAAAREAGIETALIWGVMRQESAFVAGIESRANAIGLMQLIMPTAKSMAKRLSLTATPRTLRQPEVNIRLGATYLSLLIKRFGQPLLAIPGYNAGGGAIAKGLKANPGLPLDEFVETIGAEETRKYARKVFESYAAYRFLYNQGNDRFTRVDFIRK